MTMVSIRNPQELAKELNRKRFEQFEAEWAAETYEPDISTKVKVDESREERVYLYDRVHETRKAVDGFIEQLSGDEHAALQIYYGRINF